MDPVLKQKITDKLRSHLKREPMEHEIINGQNDANLMHWIAQDDAKTKEQADQKRDLDISQLQTEAIKNGAIISS